ncbi:MAG: hypothetical protein WAM41_12860 [Psychrobacillus psychrotolerans]
MKKLNNYFFGEDHIQLTDAIWFYGTYTGLTVFVSALFIWSL